MLYCEKSPCQNGGICRERATSRTCDCCPAYSGDNCEQLSGYSIKDVEICDSKREICYYTRAEVLTLGGGPSYAPKMSLSSLHTVKHTGPESGGELCEIFQF